jgi:hypothetical protein
MRSLAKIEKAALILMFVVLGEWYVDFFLRDWSYSRAPLWGTHSPFLLLLLVVVVVLPLVFSPHACADTLLQETTKPRSSDQ